MTETIVKSSKIDHDSLVKESLDDIEIIEEILIAYLDKEILAQIDLTTIEIDSTSFIDNSYKKKFADIICSISFKNKKDTLIVLIEHQSTSDRSMALRVREYETLLHR